MRIGLFALTGIGNVVLAALHRAGATPSVVVTRREVGPYPYFAVADIAAEAAELGIPCLTKAGADQALLGDPVDLILVATYHRRISDQLLCSARHAVNIHPSLLPRYRGPNPFFWVLLNREAETGVTAHALTAELDAGAVYWQGRLALADDETQGGLRRRLAVMSAEAAVAVVAAATSGPLIGRPQADGSATYFPRPSESDRRFDPARLSMDELMAGIRACSPFPGAVVAGRLVVGLVARQPMSSHAPGEIIMEDKKTIMVAVRDGVLVLAKAAGLGTLAESR